MGIHVHLTSDEILTCAILGRQRAHRARQANRTPTGMSGASVDVRGVLCEVAVAKWLDVFSIPSVNPDAHDRDVANLQVRGTVKNPPRLHVRPKRDDPTHPFVLAWMHNEKDIEVMGWEYASEVLRFGVESDAWGTPTVFLPVGMLHAPDTIYTVLERRTTQ